jgi:hypothetical protein
MPVRVRVRKSVNDMICGKLDVEKVVGGPVVDLLSSWCGQQSSCLRCCQECPADFLQVCRSLAGSLRLPSAEGPVDLASYTLRTHRSLMKSQ